ncbi:MAG: NADH:ubiquinone reductase (Na(+)-transporting) subunit C [Parabacteroides sp.]|jgi:Na+-transporting NADH:ubiquinone oxidoreductase subunit C|uniref:Na(+)-translocating NADH-quinone reductase subunit C n=1 Tax=Macellibacteroides fermentans TaxID=879969 RepID=A0A8E1ZWS0_9PORP|nr:NADH:ubiquinone reductase (Na(+)-transporting) subunit C [Macellibacteroides fermentans]MBP7919813.1 NADH:ubiquinone reductase (Na(+)-transporting) subunit C [Parabacteroides sp.]OJV36808.1 MAG: NADH:ubiquinone reductase (Na(+)-transporting) subunit C [Bacteroidales bacterium 36-12]MBP7954534.1 NADH:ubiquinone reductase (Na(+)-transporting) subunit C [Parabacteroides sp.]MDD3254605.1 NADH:ubiquinone reductase (Na(+)-transporting) subunit C [Parabacteroides sp.]MDD3506819.1 NADH:ubiquinone r
MNRDSNLYTIVYASVMVILVALGLALTSQSLRSYQKKNEDIDKMMQILRSVRVQTTAADAEATFKSLIKESYLVDENGKQVEGDAFSTDYVKAFASKEALPVFVASIDGETKYIMAMSGAGLWGPLWGYMSVNEDKSTVYGADFSHQGETPGLGAEITQSFFSKEFYDKKLFNEAGEFKSIAIVKPGKTAEGQDYVDGISGGTITSQGVNQMILTSMGGYIKFLTSQKQ